LRSCETLLIESTTNPVLILFSRIKNIDY